ncbi:30S ribosomal protein S6 [Candidatus Latescibacterota bacterium]
MTKRYDTTFIIDGNLGVDDREVVINKFCDSLKNLGGEIEQVIRWGTRTLTHEINKRNRGFYVILYYTADPSVIKTFERELRINENILRYMTLIFDGTNPSYIVDERVKTESSYSKPKEAVSEDDESDDVLDSDDVENADQPEADLESDEPEVSAEETDESADDTASESTTSENEETPADNDSVKEDK